MLAKYSSKRFWFALFGSLLCVGLYACEERVTTKAPDSNCETVGQQCQLDDGKLGVCLYDASNQLECRDQH